MGSTFAMCNSLPRDLSFVIQGSDINVITTSKTYLKKLVLWSAGCREALMFWGREDRGIVSRKITISYTFVLKTGSHVAKTGLDLPMYQKDKYDLDSWPFCFHHPCARTTSVYRHTQSTRCWMEVKLWALYVLCKASSQTLDHTPALHTWPDLLSGTWGALLGM